MTVITKRFAVDMTAVYLLTTNLNMDKYCLHLILVMAIKYCVNIVQNPQ